MAIATFTEIDQGQRVARGMREMFEFTRMPNGSWLCETEAGKCYEVTQTGCSCPDHQFRCAEAGAICKHRCALNAKLLSEQPPSAAEWLANLDTTAIRQHVEEAKKQDEQPEQPAGAFQVTVGGLHYENTHGPFESEAEAHEWITNYVRIWRGSVAGYSYEVRPIEPQQEDFAATSARLSCELNRCVIWGEADEAAFNRIFA